ncbi:MAG: hypothetical protein GY853_00645 [PVC group bacterium]|nr:hypothetical protein [PVC group bacterium]
MNELNCYKCACKEFFIRRFGVDKYKFDQETGYYQEWEDRFRSGYPQSYMDWHSLKVWEDMKKLGWSLE